MSSPQATVKNSATAGHQPSRRGHATTPSSPSRAARSAGRSHSRASAAKGFTARVQSPMIPQLIGVATHTASQKNEGTMFSATDCEPIQPHTISPMATSPATIQRTGAGRRSATRSANLASPAVAGATARGRTSRNERNTTAAPPKTKSHSGTGRS